jgi:RHS repeat-associated protein
MKRIILSLGLLILASIPLAAQDPTDFSNGFAPYMSYDTLGFDNVNLLTGSVFIHIPIISYPQKGTLPDFSQSFNWNPPAWEYVCVYMDGWYCGFDGGQIFMSGLVVDNLLTSTADAYGEGQVLDSTGSVHNMAQAGSNYQTYDGSGITINTSSTYYAAVDKNGVEYYPFYGCGPPVAPILIVDPSGNTITGNNCPSGGISTNIPSSWTDSVSRTIPNLNKISPETSGCTTDDFPGPPSNNPVTVTICYSTFAVDNTLGGVTTTTGTFPALSSITLPNGTSWNFDYDGYGDITTVTTPTGGTVSYTWDHMGDGCTHEDISAYCLPVLAQRTVNAAPGAYPSQAKTWTYSGIGSSSALSGITDGPTTVTDPDGNQVVHTFTLLDTGDFPYSARETDTKYYQGSSGSGSLLEESITQYSWAGQDPNYWSLSFPMPYDVVPRRVITKWYSSGSVVNTSQTCAIYDNNTDTSCSATSGPDSYSSSTGQVQAWGCCDDYGDEEIIYTSSYFPIVLGSQLYKYEYDYGTSSPGSLLRKTVNHFMWQSSSSYENLGLLSIPDSVNVYDGSGNQAAETTYAYDESSRSASACQTTPCGLLTTINKYTNSSTYLTSHINYNSNGMPTDLYDANGNHTCNTYDSTGAYLYEVQHPNPASGSSCSSTLVDYFSYDSNTGLLVSHTDANSQTTSFTYDTIRRRASISYPDGGEETYTYTDSSTPNPYFVYSKKITSSVNFTGMATADGFGRTIQTKTTVPSTTCSGDYVYQDTTYDNEGRKFSVSNPYCTTSDATYGLTKTYYDAIDRATQVVPPDGTTSSENETTSYTGRCTTITDEAGKSRKSCTDGLGRMTGVWEDPSGSDYETDYTYNTLDDLISVSQSGSRSRTFTHDWLSRLISASNPESGTICYGTYSGSTCQQNGYDGDSNLIYKTDARGITATYSYDALNRLTQESYSDSTPAVKYVYDANSVPSGCSIGSFSYGSYDKLRQTAMCDGAGSEAWDYDKMGRDLTDQRITNGLTKTSTYAFNYDGSLATLTYPTGRTITYAYSDAEQQTSAEDTANSINYATSAAHGPSGALTSLSNGAYLLSTYYYNDRLQPCRIAVNSSGTAPTSCTDSTNHGNVLDLAYSFDLSSVNTPCSTGFSSPINNGDVAGINNNITSSRSQNFCYDSLNRIAKAESTSTYSTSSANCWAESYTYDAWANMTAITPVTGSYSGCTQESGLSITVNSSNQISTSGFSYDSAGSLLGDGTNGYTYNGESELITASTTSGLYCYTYDGSGRRVQKSQAQSGYSCTSTSPHAPTVSKLYWYDTGGNALDETDGSGNLTDEYVFFDGKRIARRDSSSNVDYYFADHLGTAHIVTNASGTIQDDSDFYPYGGQRAVSSTSGNTYKFTGKERDSESGLDNFGARYDSSQYGRFMSPDPLGILSGQTSVPQSLNLYSYVENNPLNAVDPDGLDCVYVGDDEVAYSIGNCIAGKNGTYVNGTIDPNSFTYSSQTGTLGFNYTNSDTGTIGKGEILNVYPSSGVSSSDMFGAVAQGTQMAAPGVNLAANLLALFGNIIAPGMMTAAQCLAGSCSKGDVAFAMLPEVAALREGGIILKEGAAVGKGAEIIEKGGGVAKATEDYNSLKGAEKVYGETKVKTLSDGTKAVLYTSSSGGQPSLAIQDAAGRTLSKYRY